MSRTFKVREVSLEAAVDFLETCTVESIVDLGTTLITFGSLVGGGSIAVVTTCEGTAAIVS